MKIFWIVIFALLLVAGSFNAYYKYYASPVNGFEYLHTLTFNDPQTGPDFCSGVAIGKHALFTASHCLIEDKTVFVENTECKIEKIENDNNDHSILLISGPNCYFKKWLNFRVRNPRVGETVEMYGEAVALESGPQYRSGYMSGTGKDDSGKSFNYFAMIIVPGDSGSLIMDGHTSVGAITGHYGPLAISYPIVFTKQQIKEAVNF